MTAALLSHRFSADDLSGPYIAMNEITPRLAADISRRLRFPVALVMTHPRVVSAKSGVLAAICALTMIYWYSGCRDLPAGTCELAALARISSAAWYRMRREIECALAEILPLVKAAYEKEVSRALSRALNSQVGGLNTAARARERKTSQAASLPSYSQTQPAVQVLPSRKSAQPQRAGLTFLQQQAKARNSSSEDVFRD